MASVSQDIYCRPSSQLATVTVSTAVCKDLVLLETFISHKLREGKKKINSTVIRWNTQTANFETSIFILIFLVMCCMITLYISGLFLSHWRNKVHPWAVQEQPGEELKKTSSSYLFSYYNEQVDSISKWKTGSLAPSFWGTGLTQGVHMLLFFFVKGKPTNPATRPAQRIPY